MKRFYETGSDIDYRTACGDLQPQQFFSNQRGGQRSQNLSALKKFIRLLSGSDEIAILKELASSHFASLSLATMDTLHDNCLSRIRDEFHGAGQKDRKKYCLWLQDRILRNF